ncbi:unnamed protein product, partial [Prorocentrum cordatum]
ADAEKHIRDKQVVAFGFDGSGSAEQVVEDLKNLLNQIVGERSGAVVLTTTGSTKFGVIEFTSIQSKVSFWKKVRDKLNDDEDAFGGVFFRNNLTTEEKDREKRMGYTKYHLSKHPDHKTKDVKIIWPKGMVVVKEGEGKERKIAWYDEHGDWRTTKTGKAVEAAVEEYMRKWREKVNAGPAEESE